MKGSVEEVLILVHLLPHLYPLPFKKLLIEKGLTEAACRKQMSRLMQKCRQLLGQK